MVAPGNKSNHEIKSGPAVEHGIRPVAGVLLPQYQKKLPFSTFIANFKSHSESIIKNNKQKNDLHFNFLLFIKKYIFF